MAIDEATPSPELIDHAALAGWLERNCPDLSGPFSVDRIGEGQSCLTFLLTGADFSAVLRRPPRGDLPAGAFDVLREHRIMRALGEGGAGVPVPAMYGSCDDPAVIGAPFYLMERVSGPVLRDSIPGETSAGQLRMLGEELVATLAAIHATDPADVGLEDLGRPQGFLERQLGRMQSQWDRIRRRDVPELDELGSWLARNPPAQSEAALIHGDYKLDNLVVDLPASGAVRAVLDWELSTLGDPLADVGWLLYFWIDPDEEPFAIPVSSVTDHAALPDREALIERYGAVTGRSLERIAWYAGFSGWKITIIMETSYQRYLAGIADHPSFAALDRGVPMMARRALEIARWTL